MNQNYSVTRRGSQWAVVGDGNQRASSIHSTQGDAIQAGKPLAQAGHGELRIQGRDGKFRESWSYGNDPHPPKG